MHASFSHWQFFIHEGEEPAIDGRIKNSWVRSQNTGLNPYSAIKTSAPSTRDHIDLPTNKFFKKAHRYINDLIQQVQSKTLALICDENGEILHAMATADGIEQELSEMGFVVGTNLKDEINGTNAIALAINKGCVAICNEFDHYLKPLQLLKGAACPIYNIDGILMGYAALYSHTDYVNSELLKMTLLSMIQGFDQALRLTRSRHRHENLKSKVETIFENDNIPAVVVTNKGYLRQINPAAMEMLELDEKDMGEKQLDKLAEFKPNILEISKSGLETADLPMEIILNKKTRDVLINRIPLYNNNGHYLGAILQLNQKGQRRNDKIANEFKASHTFNDILGETTSIAEAKVISGKVAETNINVLLIGDSGTGKEMFAQSIHNASDRKSEAFVSINCAAIPKELAESELFGYVQGAFTGALKGGNVGKLMTAHKGTIFLDEIGDMPLELQGKLLRVLEERKITHVGDSKEQPIDIRVIAATNKPILELVNKGEFRGDLYYRLGVSTIQLPSLKESKGDIPILANYFITHFNENMGKKVLGIEPAIMQRFKEHDWPGNIRELKNAIEFAIMLNQGEDHITWKNLPGDLRLSLLYTRPAEEQLNDPLSDAKGQIEKSEISLFEKAINLSGGKSTEAAKILGISRATFYRKIKKLGLIIQS